MNKISTDHLGREAYVYIRQSTQGQVRHNQESRRRQYSLQDRARELGWGKVVVIDENLGKSASGNTERSGFERLEVYMDIKAMHRNGKSIRAIAKELGLHRKTVSRHL